MDSISRADRDAGPFSEFGRGNLADYEPFGDDHLVSFPQLKTPERRFSGGEARKGNHANKQDPAPEVGGERGGGQGLGRHWFEERPGLRARWMVPIKNILRAWSNNLEPADSPML